MIKTNKWSSYIFDWDGTLANSSKLHEAAFRLALNEISSLITFEYDCYAGLTSSMVFQLLGFDKASSINLTKRKQFYYRQMIISGGLRLYPGAVGLLKYINSQGMKAYLVTSGSKESVSLGLEISNIRSEFTDVITADDVIFGKPHPESYLICIQRNSLNIKDTVAIEDSISGVQSAKASGLYVIGLREKMLLNHADECYETMNKFFANIKYRD